MGTRTKTLFPWVYFFENDRPFCLTCLDFRPLAQWGGHWARAVGAATAWVAVAHWRLALLFFAFSAAWPGWPGLSWAQCAGWRSTAEKAHFYSKPPHIYYIQYCRIFLVFVHKYLLFWDQKSFLHFFPGMMSPIPPIIFLPRKRILCWEKRSSGFPGIIRYAHCIINSCYEMQSEEEQMSLVF